MEIFAVSSIPDSYVRYAASVAADLLDNDNNGIVDDALVCAKLKEVGVLTPIFSTENQMEHFEEHYDLDLAILFKDEIDPENPGYFQKDATVEEIVHNINCNIIQYNTRAAYALACGVLYKLDNHGVKLYTVFICFNGFLPFGYFLLSSFHWV